jgi:hypothetical protein
MDFFACIHMSNLSPLSPSPANSFSKHLVFHRAGEGGNMKRGASLLLNARYENKTGDKGVRLTRFLV